MVLIGFIQHEKKEVNMEWISIIERLPPEDAYILISEYDERKTVKMPYLSIGYRLGDEWFEKDDQKVERITHWMPLPYMF